MHPRVDEFIAEAEKWQAELLKLRSIILDGGLTEESRPEEGVRSLNAWPSTRLSASLRRPQTIQNQGNKDREMHGANL